MRTNRIVRQAVVWTMVVAGIWLCVTPERAVAAGPELREALTFHASFDAGTDADFGAGNRRLHHAPSMDKRAEATVGLPAASPVVLVAAQGRFGGALRFKEKSGTTVFFKAAKNMNYRPANWSGTVSLWLSTDPAEELAQGFCDPVQITPREWNDAAFFVEFEKRETIPFRLGVYADFSVWNPQNRKFENIPAAERPLLPVEKPPFARGKWTHVVFTFENFNTGRPDGVARLYLDGRPQGMLPARKQTFTWDIEKTHIMLGLSYIGLFDELSLFNRALTEPEVAALHKLDGGVRALVK
jgi:Concanavalin A-like lectin/glucanases superfamily